MVDAIVLGHNGALKTSREDPDTTVNPVVRLSLAITSVVPSAMLAPELSPTAMPSVLRVIFAVALANTMLEVLSTETPNTTLS